MLVLIQMLELARVLVLVLVLVMAGVGFPVLGLILVLVFDAGNNRGVAVAMLIWALVWTWD